MPSVRKPHFYALTLLHVGCFALFYLAISQQGPEVPGDAGHSLRWLKIALEILASFYFFSVILKSCDYLLSPRDGGAAAAAPAARAAAGDSRSSWPPIATIYLCAGDLDEPALESLCRLDYPGEHHLYVHDDSGDPRVGGRVDDIVRRLVSGTGASITVLRRGERRGGKPGAVNHVLSCLGGRYPFVLVADNDSTAVDALALRKAVPRLEDPRIAAVQFRNVGVDARGEAPINRMLRRAIEVFDLFARHQSRHGMTLFLGHNAVLRTAALEEAGGLREGAFADDIDLSIRLVRSGWRIVYAPDIVFGETHPVSYASFCRRAYKWAFGCGQVLREHALPVLLDPRMSVSQKCGLLEFTGFYAMQALLIVYLLLVGIVLPVVSGLPPADPLVLFLSGTAIVVSIFLPSLAYLARHRRLSEWWPFALVCSVVYGSVAFTSVRGIVDGLLGRRRTWIPTNLRARSWSLVPGVVGASVFGLLLFLVPAWYCPAVLWQPSMYLFSMVFLFAPVALALYAPRRVEIAGAGDRAGRRSAERALRAARALSPSRVLTRRRLMVLLVVSALSAGGWTAFHWGSATPDHASRVAIDGDRLLVDGAGFLVKGIHYSPWLPGTGPGKERGWPGEPTVSRDLEMIRDLGANTILVHDAPQAIFPLARRFGLMVIYSYHVDWQSIGSDGTFRARAAEIAGSAAGIGREPNLLAVLLGNEVPEWVLKDRGVEFLDARIRSLYDAVKKAAPGVPVGHANWPPTRRLTLPFMDIACFNLYPAWPREVVLAGYGNYIDATLKPIAGGRPLLITEFGQNSLETSEQRQAQVLSETWGEIRSRTAGGVVFEFADEWWKNYDNPTGPDDYWRRAHAPDDEKTHDLDPEEYYGIVTSERNPKPGLEAVHVMYSASPAGRGRGLLFSLPLLALFGYTLYVFRRGR
jgi:cellulose synthase/poly-beta-1,6-N-acetylglucosamine synthase-like glycosyltransferase